MYNPVQDHQGDRQGLQHAHLVRLPGDPVLDCICNTVAYMTESCTSKPVGFANKGFNHDPTLQDGTAAAINTCCFFADFC